jgi:hypothetical protein
MKRRGISHIEAIVSFVLFIGFLAFAFFFFSPFRGGDVLNASVEFLEREVRSDSVSRMESYSIVIEIQEPPLPDELAVNINTVDIDISEVDAFVVDKDGEFLESRKTGSTVNFDREGENFVIIRFCEDFDNNDVVSGTLISEGMDYTISSSDSRDLYSEIKLKEIESAYESNYVGLKEQFNLPNRVDFAITVDFGDENIDANIGIPEEAEVISRKNRIEIIREDGVIEFADLILRVW